MIVALLPTAAAAISVLFTIVAITTQRWLVHGPVELGLWLVCESDTCNTYNGHPVSSLAIPNAARQRLLVAGLSMLAALFFGAILLLATLKASTTSTTTTLQSAVRYGAHALCVLALLLAVALAGDAAGRVRPAAHVAESLGLAIFALLSYAGSAVFQIARGVWRRKQGEAFTPPSLPEVSADWSRVALGVALVSHLVVALLAGLAPDKQFAYNQLVFVFVLLASYPGRSDECGDALRRPPAGLLVASAAMDALALGFYARDMLHEGSDLERFALMLTILSLIFKPVTLGLLLYTSRLPAGLAVEKTPLLLPGAAPTVDSEPATSFAHQVAALPAAKPAHVDPVVVKERDMPSLPQPIPLPILQQQNHHRPQQPPSVQPVVSTLPSEGLISDTVRVTAAPAIPAGPGEAAGSAATTEEAPTAEATPLGDLLSGQHDDLFQSAVDGGKGATKKKKTAEEKAAEKEQRRLAREAELAARALQEKAALEAEEARLEVQRFLSEEKLRHEQAARRKREVAELAALQSATAGAGDGGGGGGGDEGRVAVVQSGKRAPRARSLERSSSGGAGAPRSRGGPRLAATSDVEDDAETRPGRSRSFTSANGPGLRASSAERGSTSSLAAPRPLSRASSRDLRHTSSTSLDAAADDDNDPATAAAQGRLCAVCGIVFADMIVCQLHMRSHK